MPKSARRKPKQPQRRPTPLQARGARPAFPHSGSEVGEGPEADEWDENLLVSGSGEDADEDGDGDGDEDAVGAPAPSRRGSVRTATWRRSRVPYLLNDVMEARAMVTRAERDLAKKVKFARSHGATWDDVGLAVVMTRQGAAKKFG